MINHNLIIGLIVNLVTIVGVSSQSLDAAINELYSNMPLSPSAQKYMESVEVEVYEGASLDLKAKCNDGMAMFRISNNGAKDMFFPTQVTIIEDDILPGYHKEIYLKSGKHIDIELNGNHKFKLMVHQIKGHPGDSILTATLEGCGSTLNAATSNFDSEIKAMNNNSEFNAMNYNFDADDHAIVSLKDPMTFTLVQNNFTSSLLSNTLKVYPNPASDVLNISLGNIDSKTVLFLYDMFGKMIWSNSMDQDQQTASIQLNTVKAVYSGTYILVAKSDQSTLTQRVNINKH